MKSIFLISLLTAQTFAADQGALQDKIASLRDDATAAANKGQFSVAEGKLTAAISECSGLPPSRYSVKADLLRELGMLFERQNQTAKAESAYKQRLSFLEAQQREGEEPVLDIGIALFDLQSRYEAHGRKQEAQEYMERAKTFYETCKRNFSNLRSVCDRHLADVEGLHGSELFLQKRFDEATPFLLAVTSREDAGVRPETLYAALMAYAQILVDQKDMQSARPLIQRATRIKAANPGLFPQ